MGIKNKIETIILNFSNVFFVAVFFCFLLISSNVYSQEKESEPVRRTKSSATINGVHYYLHTVEKGQTLYAIAKFYGFEVSDIVIENPEAIDGIKPGQILKIPFEKKKVVKKITVDTSNYVLHKVEKGQTIYSITKQYNITDEKLKLMNPELMNGLKTGQVLKIPVDKPVSKEGHTEKETKTDNSSLTHKTETKTDAVVTKEKVDFNLAADRPQSAKIKYKGEKKEGYNVALFLPFHADEANAVDMEKLLKDEVKFSSKTNVALEFYEGAMLAIDSLKKQHLNATVFVYDVDDSDSANIAGLLKKPELRSMDLIIGPLYGSSFMPVAKFAKENEIPIVSPFTQVNKILFNNPYVCKVSSSTALQMEQMALYVVDSFRTQNLILLNTLTPLSKDEQFFTSFKQTAGKYLKTFGLNDSINEVKNLAAMQAILSTSKTNVIILPSTNQSVVTEYISKLNTYKEKYKIVLFGMQSWTSYDNLDFEYLNSLSVHIPSNNFVDYGAPGAKRIIKLYRDKYNTEPGMYAYQGFDVCYYFISMLQTKGSGFLNDITGSPYTGVQANIHMTQFSADNSGFENKDIYILKYQDFKLVKANK